MTNKKWLPLVLLGIALLVWAGLFAAGAYFELSADKPHHDLRKPLIILAAMVLFLAFWGLALWLRARRKPPQL
jgi:membrane protein DedA with SNARE-associated domain